MCPGNRGRNGVPAPLEIKSRGKSIFGLAVGVTATGAAGTASRAAGTAAGFAGFDDVPDSKQDQNQQDTSNN